MRRFLVGQSGFGLVEVIVSLFITGIVSLSAVTLISVVEKNKKEVEKDLTSTSAHLLSVQIANSKKASEAIVKSSLSLSQMRCLEGTGVGCTSSHFLGWKPLQLPSHIDTYFDTKKTCTNPNQGCSFQRKMMFRMLCDSPNKCSGVEVAVGMFELINEEQRILHEHHFSIDSAAEKLASLA